MVAEGISDPFYPHHTLHAYIVLTLFEIPYKPAESRITLRSRFVQQASLNPQCEDRRRMSVLTSEAVVLRTWPVHEADLIVSFFTRDYGRMKGVAKSALKSHKRFGGALEP